MLVVFEIKLIQVDQFLIRPQCNISSHPTQEKLLKAPMTEERQQGFYPSGST